VRKLADIVQAELNKYPGDDRPVFIGQAPSRNGDPWKPLTGMPGRRLASLAGMYPLEFYVSTVRANLLPTYMGEDGDGDAFPTINARVAAIESAAALDGRTVVFVGRRVAQAFGCRGDWFRWDRVFLPTPGFEQGIRYSTMPHPSGRNRYWNDEGNRKKAEAFLRELLRVESSVPRLRMLRARGRACEERKFERSRGCEDGRIARSRVADRVPAHQGEPDAGAADV